MKSNRTRLLSVLLAFCLIVGILPAAYAADLSDAKGHWAEEELLYFVDEGCLEGYPDGTYRPDQEITRAEFMKIVNRAAGLTDKSSKVDQYTDVSKDAWYYDEVAIALEAGYTNGKSDNKMEPEANITREEAITIIARLAGLTDGDAKVLSQFTDGEKFASWSQKEAAAMVEAGYLGGYPDKTVRPQGILTRAEGVVLLYRCLELIQPVTGNFVLMNIPYADFYAADVRNDVAVDAFTSATKNKTRTGNLAGGSYHKNADGTDISGVIFPVLVAEGVDLSAYKQVTDEDSVTIEVTNRGQTSSTTYTGAGALFENEDYAYFVLSKAPRYYKELTVENGKLTFGKTVGRVQVLSDATAELTTESSYGDYQIGVDGLDLDMNTDQVYGVVLSTDKNDYGLRHLENIWRVTELAICTGFTDAVHNCPTSSEHYTSIMGQTITKITYYTSKGIYEIPTELYVPVKFEGGVEVADAKADAGSTTLTAKGLPDDYQAEYAVAGLEGVGVSDGKLQWTNQASGGAYTLTVTDKGGKYAPMKASFVLTSDKIPAKAADGAITAADGATEAAFQAYLQNIASVSVDGTDYAASGRGSTVIIQKDGTVNMGAAPFQTAPKDGKAYQLEITATGYSQKLTLSIDKVYLYASLTYAEYWENEGVYNATNTDSSDVADRETANRDGSIAYEYDKGGFDAVTRATSNHGLHRGSFQQDVVIHTAGGDYEPVYWTDADNFVAADGKTYNKNEIGITSYEITGIRYVPVVVAAKDFAAFVSEYDVVLNGQTLAGGYSEQQLSAYTGDVARVSAATNGLKTATLAGGTWSFGKRQIGTDSGIEGKTLATATNVSGTVKDYSGNYGEFLRMDITGDGYGALGAAMQSVVWTYYGNDSSYTKALASYGTKFAADNWMHKSMGVQLGLTDSLRCQLPEGTTGEGYWTVTVYALGYADYTEQILVTADNLPKAVEPITAEQKAQITTLKDQAEALLKDYDASKASTALKVLKEHYDEAVAMLADPEATSAEANELIAELPGLISAVEAEQPTAANGTFTGTAKTEPDEYQDFDAYDVTVVVEVADGKIASVTAQGGGSDNAPYLNKALNGRGAAVGVAAQLAGKTVSEVESMSIDAVSGATCSSNAIVTAVRNALAS